MAGVEYAGPMSLCEVNTALGALQVEVPSSIGRPSTGERVHIIVNESAVHLIQLEQVA